MDRAVQTEENDNQLLMCRDFLLRTGADEKTADICTRLIRHMNEGDTCLELTAEECEILRAFPGISEAPDDSGIFVLSQCRLYTRKYWLYEMCIRSKIAAVSSGDPGEVEIPDEPEFNKLHDCQKEAVKVMCSSSFSILSGGPGTGKTYTISRAVKLAQQSGDIRIALAAPTGKAANRVNETMQKEIETLKLSGVNKAETIHSLLKPSYTGVTFTYNRSNPLPFDWVIIDEASMVDLPLMAKLLDALPDNCRLTLVGDAHQLASVEPGRVFGDLCANSNIAKSELTTSTRFPAGGEIDCFARAVNSGNAGKMFELLKQDTGLLHFYAFPEGKNIYPGEWKDFAKLCLELFSEFAVQNTPEGALEKLDRCRILCALRRGPFGMEKINGFLTHLLQKHFPETPLPLMITGNDRNLNVWNGDVGVVMPGGKDLWLPDPEQKCRPIPLELLPDTEMAFASTIHKAQGSEYQDVVILLPADQWLKEDSAGCRLLTRELLYTAVTRTKKQIFLYSGCETLRRCCSTAVVRSTGLIFC